MIFNIAVIVIVGSIAWVWAGRGLFSALIHLVCTLFAGAIAFGFWELAASSLLGIPQTQEIAWAIGLVIPFAIALAVLRLATNKLVPKNIDLDDGTNFIGGVLLGAASGVVSAGILVVAVGHIPLGKSLFGYQALAYDSGNLVRGDKLWLPADRVVASLYGMVSVGSLSTSTPLAVRRPDIVERAALTRMTYGGAGRSALTPDDFEIAGRYTVEARNVQELLSDTFTLNPSGNPVAQNARDMSNETFPAGSRIEGFVIEFRAGASEKFGQVVAGASTVTLTVRNDGGDVKTLIPVAMVTNKGAAVPDFVRWRLDASDIFIPSVGGAVQIPMAFEFVVPQGYQPLDLFVRNVRAEVPGESYATYQSAEARDEAIKGRSMFVALDLSPEGIDESQLDFGESQDVAPPEGFSRQPGQVASLGNRIGGTFNRGNRGGSLEINEDNEIVNGSVTLSPEQFRERGLDPKLAVDRLYSPGETVIIQADISVNSKASLLGRAFERATQVLPPTLIDVNGQSYAAVGYIFETSDKVEVRYTPGQPLRGLAEIPELSQSRPDDQLRLIFRVSSGADVAMLTLGPKVIVRFDPPMTTTFGRR